MATIKSIQSEQEYRAALARIWEIFHAEPGTPEGDELDSLADLVEVYEDIHYPIPDMPPGMAILGRIENLEMSPDHLIPCIGSREMVDEVLAGQREVTVEMAKALYEKLHIDVRHLLGQPTAPAANG